MADSFLLSETLAGRSALVISVAALGVACVTDLRARRIPNQLNGTLALGLLALHVHGAGLTGLLDALIAGFGDSYWGKRRSPGIFTKNVVRKYRLGPADGPEAGHSESEVSALTAATRRQARRGSAFPLPRTLSIQLGLVDSDDDSAGEDDAGTGAGAGGHK